ncbi:MAG: inositol monophosphatase family protein [Anaerolineales bacterium]|jgi:myo-inositol-1(or 4)-monophosphatase
MTNPTLAYIERLARQAGQILRAGYQQEHQVDYKGVIDLVTEIDRKSEDYLLGEIRKDFPDHNILAEESGGTRGHGQQWYIDPLDGTVNYAHNIPIFSVSIAYASNGTLSLGAVYDPMRDEMFTAERGKGAYLNGSPLHVSSASDLQKSLLVTGFPYDIQNPEINNLNNFIHFSHRSQGVRRLGSAALDLSYVAAGRFDGFWEMALKPWDVAAGGLICEEAGARVTNVHGEADFISPPQSILATAPGIHTRMLEELKQNHS